MDLMQDLRRTCYCGEVTKAGETVVVGGFVQKVRNLGNLIFIDLRDRTGIVQLAFNDQTDRAIFEKAASCHSEYVLLAKGVVAERSEHQQGHENRCCGSAGRRPACAVQGTDTAFCDHRRNQDQRGTASEIPLSGSPSCSVAAQPDDAAQNCTGWPENISTPTTSLRSKLR